MNYRHRRTAGTGAGLASVIVAAVMLFNAIPASAVDFAHPAFKRVWDRTDSLVASGQMQIGNNALINRYPAIIPISGDTDDANAPTYVSFASVSNTRKGDHPQPDKRNQFATNTINKAEQVGDDPTKATPDSKIDYYEATTKHNIPHAFWSFLNA